MIASATFHKYIFLEFSFIKGSYCNLEICRYYGLREASHVKLNPLVKQ